MFFNPEIISVKTNEELQLICEEQWNEIEYLKQDNNELKKDIEILSREIDILKNSLERQLNIFL